MYIEDGKILDDMLDAAICTAPMREAARIATDLHGLCAGAGDAIEHTSRDDAARAIAALDHDTLLDVIRLITVRFHLWNKAEQLRDLVGQPRTRTQGDGRRTPARIPRRSLQGPGHDGHRARRREAADRLAADRAHAHGPPHRGPPADHPRQTTGSRAVRLPPARQGTPPPRESRDRGPTEADHRDAARDRRRARVGSRSPRKSATDCTTYAPRSGKPCPG